MKQLTKEEFESWITRYEATHGVALKASRSLMTHDPVVFYGDFSGGKMWPESTVAKVVEKDSGSEYFVKEP